MTNLIRNRRVTFSNSLPKTREERLATNNRFAQSDTSDDGEEIDDEEEEQQDRDLSNANGEAVEVSSGTKREQTDKEIEAEYSSRKRRKPNIVLKPSHLIGDDGLVKIRSEFPDILPKCKRNSVSSAASYSKLLRKAYQKWAHQMFPALAMEDVLSRVEVFGSKREVKGYLQTMREVVRNDHLERVMGKEKAEKMLEELETGLQQQRVQEEIDKEDYELHDNFLPKEMEEVNEDIMTSKETQNKTSAPVPVEKHPVDSESEEEFEFVAVRTTAPQVESSTFVDTDDEEEQLVKKKSIAAARKMITPDLSQKRKKTANSRYLLEDEEETESLPGSETSNLQTQETVPIPQEDSLNIQKRKKIANSKYLQEDEEESLNETQTQQENDEKELRDQTSESMQQSSQTHPSPPHQENSNEKKSSSDEEITPPTQAMALDSSSEKSTNNEVSDNNSESLHPLTQSLPKSSTEKNSQEEVVSQTQATASLEESSNNEFRDNNPESLYPLTQSTQRSLMPKTLAVQEEVASQTQATVIASSSGTITESSDNEEDIQKKSKFSLTQAAINNAFSPLKPDEGKINEDERL